MVAVRDRTNRLDNSPEDYMMPHSKNDRETLELSALERLPPEIRNRIYALTAVSKNDIDLEAALQQPALLATNSNIRAEVLPIFYGANTFLARVQQGDLCRAIKESAAPFSKYSKLMKRVGAFFEHGLAPEIDAKLRIFIGNDRLDVELNTTTKNGLPICPCFREFLERECAGVAQSSRDLADSLFRTSVTNLACHSDPAVFEIAKLRDSCPSCGKLYEYLNAMRFR